MNRLKSSQILVVCLQQSKINGPAVHATFFFGKVRIRNELRSNKFNIKLVSIFLTGKLSYYNFLQVQYFVPDYYPLEGLLPRLRSQGMYNQYPLLKTPPCPRHSPGRLTLHPATFNKDTSCHRINKSCHRIIHVTEIPIPNYRFDKIPSKIKCQNV